MERGTQEMKLGEADGLGKDEPVRGHAWTLCPPGAAAWNPEGSEEGSGELWCGLHLSLLSSLGQTPGDSEGCFLPGLPAPPS